MYETIQHGYNYREMVIRARQAILKNATSRVSASTQAACRDRVAKSVDINHESEYHIYRSIS